MLPKLAVRSRIAGAVRVQSETVREVTEFGLLPEPSPIAKPARVSLPLQLLTNTVSMLNF